MRRPTHRRYPGARRSRGAHEGAARRQGSEDGADADQDDCRAGLKARLLGVDGWYSTNILGNRDGEVLDDPESFKTKEESKKSVLDYILQPQLYPDLYEELCHVVRINYYPPRGDNKEGWDNIDLVGWLGYKMQLKINFLCRDSILAAPIVLDVALFLDLAKRANMHGIQEWLSFYFKSPVHAPGCILNTISSSS
jgi:myo-inositol-1-phosphate synthase